MDSDLSRLLQKNPGEIVTNFNFTRLFSQAWFQAVTAANIIAGFQRAGVHPLNPSVIEADSDTLLQDQVPVWLIVVVSDGGAPSDGLTDVAGTSTNLTDTADS